MSRAYPLTPQMFFSRFDSVRDETFCNLSHFVTLRDHLGAADRANRRVVAAAELTLTACLIQTKKKNRKPTLSAI